MEVKWLVSQGTSAVSFSERERSGAAWEQAFCGLNSGSLFVNGLYSAPTLSLLLKQLFCRRSEV